MFQDCLSKFNDRMILENRNVLLLIDNSTSHVTSICLSSVEIAYLSPNTTSHLQSMDAGIIRSFTIKIYSFNI